MMRNRIALLLLALVLCHGVMAMEMGSYREWEEEEEESGGSEEKTQGSDWFLLQKSKRVVQTNAGEMRVIQSYASHVMERPMHLGFITMEPRSLFVPQYLDSNLIIFIRRGEARIGFIYKGDMAERRLKSGDIYRIPAGSAFYLYNTEEGQRLHAICSIDTSESLGLGAFKSFYIAGGSNPTSILSGFEHDTLKTALNITSEELRELMTRQQQGPIVYVDDSRSPRTTQWKKFLELKEHERLQHLKSVVNQQGRLEEDDEEEQEEAVTWSWRKLLKFVLATEDDKRSERSGSSPHSCNIYDRKPDFKNNYGWSIALDGSDYKPLKHSGMGVYLVNLTAGSMMAPHVNPSATEFGIVLRGSGTIQIVYPNGTQAMKAKVREGDVFWVPRYFPFCQIASRTSQFEFFGFTTSARRNRPQFLVGASSILQTFRNPVLAAAFGMSEERVQRIIESQRETVILPPASASPSDVNGDKYGERVSSLIKGFENDMVVGFD